MTQYKEYIPWAPPRMEAWEFATSEELNPVELAGLRPVEGVYETGQFQNSNSVPLVEKVPKLEPKPKPKESKK